MKVCVAAAQYPIDAIGSWTAYEQKLGRWFQAASDHGAQLLLFPEYGAMELARMSSPEIWSDLQLSIDFVGGLRSKIDALHGELAAKHRVHVVAASLPQREASGNVHNIARVISPQGKIGEQRKLMMTRFERDKWRIDGGRDICVFDTSVGCFGVAICYDAEFPLIARAMSDAGAAFVVVPSCTDSMRGYHRVRVAAQARALENQCFVIQSSTVGEALWSPAVDANIGGAGVFGPPDLGFPEDGVVASGVINEAQWLFADLDLTAVTRVRLDGFVLNNKQWREQPGAAPLKATIVSL
jgi:predicted amidohydrolase